MVFCSHVSADIFNEVLNDRLLWCSPWKGRSVEAGSGATGFLKIAAPANPGDGRARDSMAGSGEREVPGYVAGHFHEPSPLLNHPILSELPRFATGLTDLNGRPRSATNALDYLRAPLFDWPSGVALPPDAPNPDDDLQDIVSRQLDNLKQADGELFAFGSHWRDPAPKPGIDTEFETVNGMHDIHMNQGNPSGSFGKDNGVFNDGGLILSFPDHVVGLCFRFKTQWLPTDAHGNRIAGVSKEIPAGAVPSALPDTDQHQVFSPAFPHVYVERALVNPIGDKLGKETVVIGNTTSTAIDPSLSRSSI